MKKASRQMNHGLQTCQEALNRGAWEESRACFEAALEREETPEALEGLGMAAWWLNDAMVTFNAREGAYRMYRERGDRVAAARMAMALAWDYKAFRGERAVANGWLRRARRLLEGLDPTPEHGWLALREGATALGSDTSAAKRLGAEAASLGRYLGSIDLEMVGLSLQGLAMVSEGEVNEGMSRLDEVTAAVVAGELTDLSAIGLASCYLIEACERVRDYDRAAQWCERLKEFCKRWRFRPLFGVCRTHYAAVLVCRGVWSEAETELESATHELATTRPAQVVEGTVQLAELRRRQGRMEEAAKLFEQSESLPSAQLGLAALALDQDDAATAVELVERFMRRIGPEDRLRRAPGLEMLIRALIALEVRDQATAALADLRSVVAAVPTEPMRASLSFADGLVAAAAGEHETARRHFEDAIDLFERTNAPFEKARARLELARTLCALDRREAARRETRAALKSLRTMGAAWEADRATVLLQKLEPEAHGRIARASNQAGLTRREIEVLHLVAQGLSNQEIAVRLVLSEHTIHRHVANILSKLHLPSRAAAVAYAAQQGLL